VSNSLKHAFPPSREDNEIYVDVHRTDDHRFTLVVRDNGVGLPQELDFRNTESLGLELVCIFTEQIKGTIELDRSNGTTFTITFAELGGSERVGL
jgi:two-component sensor histidine kinase